MSKQLTAKEIEIVRLISSGMKNQEIADALIISERTVRSHVSNIISKLGLSSRTQVTVYAIQNGIAPMPAVSGELSAREKDIAVNVAKGKSSQEIADALVISERTARTHISNILRKLDLTNRTQIALLAIAQNWINVEEVSFA